MSTAEFRTTSIRPSGSLRKDSSYLVERLADEMSAAWDNGRQARAEEFLDRHAELQADPEAAARLIHEEICLRMERGQNVSSAEIRERFPQWQKELDVLLEFHRLFQPSPSPPLFPEVGERIGECQLEAELGRGASGRVFLASQPALADRPVVLKITPCDGQEHLSLARLQHTHIVPLFWVQDCPKRDLRLLCMPFLGSITLARVLERLHQREPAQRTGRDILRVFNEDRLKFAALLPPPGPECQVLENSSYVHFICLLGECLADALNYAHQRGLVHLDLKPSNVLLAADGQPMILDFHLARKPIEKAEITDWMGGTPEYMSPEQRDAFMAACNGRPVPVRVDGRSDIYSLGLLLSDALAGCKQDSKTAHPNSAVSVGLKDILKRCLETDANARYPNAAALADDLRRHREDRPLRGVGNRSLHERWRKWRRRRPHTLPWIAVVLALGSALASAGHLVMSNHQERRQAAENALLQGKEQLRGGQFAQSVTTLIEGQRLVDGLLGGRALEQAIAGRLAMARCAKKAKELHATVNALRLSPIEFLSLRGLLVFDAACRNAWEDRILWNAEVGPELPLQIKEDFQTDLLDLAILWSNLRVQLAPPAHRAKAHRQALDILAEAEKMHGPNVVLVREKESHARALGLVKLADSLARQAANLPPRTGWDQYALGRFWLQAGNLDAAARHLEQAIEVDPSGFLPHYYRGVCAYRRRHFSEAINEFTFCIGRHPMAECFLYRGLARAAVNEPSRALKDYHQALQRNPNLAQVFSAGALSPIIAKIVP